MTAAVDNQILLGSPCSAADGAVQQDHTGFGHVFTGPPLVIGRQRTALHYDQSFSAGRQDPLPAPDDIFKSGDEFIGKTVGISGEHLTGAEMAAAFTKVLGKEVGYNAIPPEIYRSFGFPGAEDLGNMFQFKRDFDKDFRGARKPDVARSLNPSLQTFGEWLTQNAGRIPLE